MRFIKIEKKKFNHNLRLRDQGQLNWTVFMINYDFSYI